MMILLTHIIHQLALPSLKTYVKQRERERERDRQRVREREVFLTMHNFSARLARI
jgi:hypothetical protein